ncbi:hypothetical protein [Streptosporangium sp. NPDC087985]|uniref:hypothetical protein n=1 Tax=Streptosporangium sp. NPDC087985 TaxID=3366196 RepID=UPI003813ADC3
MTPGTRLGQVKAQVTRAADRVGPMATQARDMAAQARDMATQARDMAAQARDVATQARDRANDKVFVAREWAAPRLDAAAHSFEEQLAPKISAMLSQAATRMDPAPAVKSRKWPMFLLFSGVVVGVIGFAMYRRSAEQWTEVMKDSTADASRWMGEKAQSTKDKVSEVAHSVTSKTDSTASTAEKISGRADAQADQVSKKSS